MVIQTAQELSVDEIQLINHVREIKNGSGFGEVLAIIQDGKIKIVKQTTVVKI
jgi:pantoate kinase